MKPDLDLVRRFLARHGPPGAVLAGVTGAHYYGFPSPDSDVDLKGIHVAPTRDVVSLKPPASSVDYLDDFEGVEVDYTSHELAFALGLLVKGNGNILERILSPFQALDSAPVLDLQELARGAVSRRFFHHYRGFFGRMRDDWLKAEPKTVKGLLYAFRSALTGIHLLRTGECVGDVTELAARHGFPRVSDLVARKRAGREHGEMHDGGDFDLDLGRLESLLEQAHSDSPLPAAAANTGDLNDFLVAARRRHFD